MAVAQIQAAPRWRQIGLWSVKALLAAAFFAAGSAKLYGVPMMVQTFEHVGVGPWFRYLTGFLEVVGAAAVLIPTVAGFAAVLLAAIMVGATLAHLLAVPGSPIPAIVLFALSALVALAHRDQTAAVARIVVPRD